jgi:C4-dicarboxylate-specific signal transduction histidine kinase
MASLEERVAELTAQLATSERERQAERTGRIRAERALRDARASVRHVLLAAACVVRR